MLLLNVGFQIPSDRTATDPKRMSFRVDLSITDYMRSRLRYCGAMMELVSNSIDHKTIYCVDSQLAISNRITEQG